MRLVPLEVDDVIDNRNSLPCDRYETKVCPVEQRRRRLETQVYRHLRAQVSKKALNRAHELVLDSLGFPRYYSSPEQFSSELDGLREMAFQVSRVDDFRDLYFQSEVLSKFCGDLVRGFGPRERKEAAFEGFRAAEKQCEVSNALLASWESDVRVPTNMIRRAQRLVRSVLGTLDLAELPMACNFGPGATTMLKRAESSHQNKWHVARHVTVGALPYAVAFTKWMRPDIVATFEVVDGNRVDSVPKSWKTDRVIAIEPCWNMFFQKGVGRMIRRRLQRFGLLRKDAKEYHMRLAKLGSKDKSLATLDLKAASDTVSYALVKALLPEDWFRLLVDLRSESGDLGGERVLYHKFSSMGNGYTFELETLIFWALTSACFDSKERDAISVFGDDIICPSYRVPEVINTLQGVGLVINTRKSFWGDHPFRESCGGHYFGGVDVTPFYYRQKPRNVSDLIVLHNHIVERARAQVEPFMPDVCGYIRRLLPRSLRGPRSVAGCLHSEWDDSRPYYDRHMQAFSVHVVTTYRREADVSSLDGSYLYSLWQMLRKDGTVDELDEALTFASIPEGMSVERVSTQFVDKSGWDLIKRD